MGWLEELPKRFDHGAIHKWAYFNWIHHDNWTFTSMDYKQLAVHTSSDLRFKYLITRAKIFTFFYRWLLVMWWQTTNWYPRDGRPCVSHYDTFNCRQVIMHECLFHKVEQNKLSNMLEWPTSRVTMTTHNHGLNLYKLKTDTSIIMKLIKNRDIISSSIILKLHFCLQTRCSVSTGPQKVFICIDFWWKSMFAEG